MSLPIGDWTWDNRTERLTLSPEPGSFAEFLSGVWTLADLSRVLDGLSAAHLTNLFVGDLNAVSCILLLADGRRLRLIGGQRAEGMLSGLILSDQDGGGPPHGLDELMPDLVPVYQPIFEISGQSATGFEALARWQQTDQTALDHLHDRTLASNMLIEAVNALAHWRSCSGRDDLYVQVNVTAEDLSDPGFPDLISALITGYDLPEGALRLELTEHAALRDSAQVIEMVERISQLGVRMVLDDFGSGHSSFLWLAHLPADAIKVDASLISELDKPRVRTILKSIARLARQLGQLSVAEGVEDAALLPLLESLGFTHAQGFGLSRPLSVDDVTALLLQV